MQCDFAHLQKLVPNLEFLQKSRSNALRSRFRRQNVISLICTQLSLFRTNPFFGGFYG